MSDDPVPAYFSWRYLALWSILEQRPDMPSDARGSVIPLTASMKLCSPLTTGTLVNICYRCVLGAVAAQLKKINPDGPPPMKDPSPLTGDFETMTPNPALQAAAPVLITVLQELEAMVATITTGDPLLIAARVQPAVQI